MGVGTSYNISFYGENYMVYPLVSKYRNGRLAVMLMCTNGEPFADLTVNLVDAPCPEGCAYLDTNNFPQGERFVALYRLAEPTGKYARSGYCTYPLYRFNMRALTGKKSEKKDTGMHPFGL